jgi:hypothetical protein
VETVSKIYCRSCQPLSNHSNHRPTTFQPTTSNHFPARYILAIKYKGDTESADPAEKAAAEAFKTRYRGVQIDW